MAHTEQSKETGLSGWAIAGLVVGLVGLVAAAVMAVLLWRESDDSGGSADSGELDVTAQGVIVEPAGNVGPDAFTPAFTTDSDEICDVEQFLAELQSRPDAVSEWARILGIDEEDVPAFVRSLEPAILDEGMQVTNHGLHDGVAYARQSWLDAGTSVLLLTEDTEPKPTPALPTPPPDFPVTRCKCGNPLLPPYQPADGTPPTRPPSSTTTSTTEEKPPPDQPPPDEPPPDEPPPDEPPPDEPPPDEPPPDEPPPDESPPDESPPDDSN